MQTLAIATEIPQNEFAEFMELEPRCRMEITRWLDAMKHLVAAKPVGKAIAQIAAAFGLSPQRCRGLYDAYRHTGDWRVFINNKKYKPCAKKLPDEFRRYCLQLREENQRDKGRAALRALIRSWQACKEIPGYPRPSDWPTHLQYPRPGRCGIPDGWSYKNFMRIKPTAFERSSVQVGLGSAIAKYAPKVFTTRKELWVGSHYMFDDVKHDFFTYVCRSNQVARVWEFGCLDVFSACRFAWGDRPSLEREDGKYDGLKGEDMRMLLASVFFNIGYSPRGTVCMTEHGTAAMPDDVADLLEKFSGGKIIQRCSSMTGKEQALAGMWRGRGGGNPRHKSPLEAWHALMHNELANVALIPAQTGQSIDRRPEALFELLDYADDIAKAMLKLPAEQAAKLILPMLEYHTEFLPLLLDLYGLINGRIDHDLEGWVEAGNLIAEYRSTPESDAWVSQLDFPALPLGARLAISQAAQQDRRCRRARYLSPAEVFDNGKSDLIRIPPYICAAILGDRYAREAEVRNGYIKFDDQTISPSELRFYNLAQAPDGSELLLPDREKYKVILNPFDPQQLFVHNAKGGYVGMAKRDIRVNRADDEAIHEREGHVGHQVARMLEGVRDRHAARVGLISEMKEHNRRVIAGLPTTLEAKAEARETTRRIRREKASVSDLITKDPEPTSNPEPSQRVSLRQLLNANTQKSL